MIRVGMRLAPIIAVAPFHLLNMVDQDRHCIDILIQVSAALTN